MSKRQPKLCIYPGCRRPAVPPHLLGGPQPSFCDLEAHNALTAHQERERLRRGSRHQLRQRVNLRRRRSDMADEAYRAVFLRVHPTGKMVLSLTTESDGRELEYAQLVADQLGVPRLDVKVVPADADRFGVGHGFNSAPSTGTPGAIEGATAKILAKAKLLAGMALDAPPDSLRWDAGAFESDGSAEVRTIADLAMYAHGTGALPAGVEGGLDAQTVYVD